MKLRMKRVPSVADKTIISYRLNDSWTILTRTFSNYLSIVHVMHLKFVSLYKMSIASSI